MYICNIIAPIINRRLKLTETKIDFLGTSTSLLCAVHCAALPFVLSSGMVGSHSFLTNPIFEFVIILATLAFVFMSIWKPFLKDRTKKIPFYLSLIGLLLIMIHHAASAFGTLVIVLGGLLVAIAHIYSMLSTSHTHNSP